MRFISRRGIAAVGIAAIAIVTTGCGALFSTVSKTAINGNVPSVQYLHYTCSPGVKTTDNKSAQQGDLAIANGSGVFFVTSDNSQFDCTFTEPANGGATSVSITCTSVIGNGTCESAPGSLIVRVTALFAVIQIAVVNDYTIPSTPPTTSSGPPCPLPPCTI